jgi:hypothetical protein
MEGRAAMSDRWLNAKTVDFSDLPVTQPAAGVAPMRPARRLPHGNTPPNMPAWPSSSRYRNARADITHEPGGDR